MQINRIHLWLLWHSFILVSMHNMFVKRQLLIFLIWFILGDQTTSKRSALSFKHGGYSFIRWSNSGNMGYSCEWLWSHSVQRWGKLLVSWNVPNRFYRNPIIPAVIIRISYNLNRMTWEKLAGDRWDSQYSRRTQNDSVLVDGSPFN